MSITVLLPENLYSAPLRALLEPLLPPGSVIRRPEDGMEDLQNRRLLFAVALDPSGCNLAYYGMLRALRGSDTLLRGSVAGVIVTGVGEFYTKDVARDMVFAANQAGCAFLGRPLVEATGSLRNFRIQAQIGGVDEKTAFRLAVRELIARLEALTRRIHRGSSGSVPKPAEEPEQLVSGPFVLDEKSRILYKSGKPIDLTQVEFQIMELFFRNPGTALVREKILEGVWGKNYFGDVKIVDVNIRRLRMKIEDEPSSPQHILTVWGYGYRWNA